MNLRRTVTGLATPLLIAVTTVTAFAQVPESAAPAAAPVTQVAPAPPPATGEGMPGWSDLFTPLKGDFQRMVSRNNLVFATFGAATAATAHSWDTKIAGSRWVQGGRRDAFEPGQTVGSVFAQAGGAVATYAIGRATGNARIATLGAKLFRAQVAAQVTTQAVKFSTHRTRPDGTTLSFPSGHTASAFATASVLHAELGWKAGVPAYAAAAWVAASRVQMDRHYLSDVIAGATVGLLAGRSVTVGSGRAKFSIAPMVVPGGFGATVVKVGR